VAAAARGDHFAVSVWTASAAPQLGGALAAVDGIDLRMPYQSDPVTRAKINGALIPSSSVGNNNTWIDMADRVILEVNSWQPAELEGMHDIYYGAALPPHRKPLQILMPTDRFGVPYLRCPSEKIIAVAASVRRG
jgi:succinyl-CoA:acetate CoA-transferase